MSKRIALAVLASALIAGGARAESPFYGIAKGMDGDSLLVGQREVRLFGIDAPEFNQTCKHGGQNWSCGAEAANKLSVLVTGKDVRCVAVGTDQHERTLARCTVGTTDVNRTMVTSGFAVAYRRYSFDYVSAENTAKVNKRGIWAGGFEMPSAFRQDETPVVRASSSRREGPTRSKSVRSSAAPVASSGCAIKGNRGSNGWIYHLPGTEFYGRTRAEQMFCSEGEAQAAGYRRAKVR